MQAPPTEVSPATVGAYPWPLGPVPLAVLQQHPGAGLWGFALGSSWRRHAAHATLSIISNGSKL